MRNSRFTDRSASFGHGAPSASTSRHWWSKLKAAVKWSSQDNIPPLVVDSLLSISSLDKANALNSAFAKQCSANTAMELPCLTPAQRAFTFSPISETELLNVLQRLQIQKPCGLDRLHNRLLKECANQIVKPLLHIFNLSLSSGRFPKQWKVARIQPVYKQKGD